MKMKSPEVIEKLADHPKYQMSADEERLHDLLNFKKTGKRLNKFKKTGQKRAKLDPDTTLNRELLALKPVGQKSDVPLGGHFETDGQAREAKADTKAGKKPAKSQRKAV